MGFLLRWLFAFVLLAVTYNPTSFNFVRWARDNWDTSLPLIVLGGLILLVIYVVFLTAIFRGIGRLGVTLVLAVAAALIWVLVSYGWLSLDNPSVMTWVGLIALSVVLAIGMYWGILWRRISGQIEADDEAGL
jgi:O-antigen/teichoic acid export membrane protein